MDRELRRALTQVRQVREDVEGMVQAGHAVPLRSYRQLEDVTRKLLRNVQALQERIPDLAVEHADPLLDLLAGGE